MNKIVIAILSLLVQINISAQSLSPEQYIDTYKEMAIREMKRMGVPAAITLAQGLLETENGNSDLVKKSNNHFGIKCKASWTGSSVFHDDDAQGECFRKYNNAEDSYRDHSNYLRGSDRYSFLFKLDPNNYKSWAYGLKRAGYATNPRYPEILIKSIEQYNLQQYTQQGINDVPVFDAEKYRDDKNDPGNGNDSIVSENKFAKTQFNGLNAVFGIKGTSLLAIATQYDIALIKILEYNDLQTDGLLKDDQWVFLEKKMKQGNRDFYLTEKEETLYEVSQANGIQLAYLVQYNNIKDGEIIKQGIKINLRPFEEKDENINNTSTRKMHEVKPKEGLYAIARKYNISVADIKEWNNLTTDDLKVGQQLIISK